MTCEIPSEEIDRSSSMPLIVLTPCSILSVTSVSICSGAAPGWTVVTTMVGISIFGKRSTPSFVNENAPMTVNERMRTVANTGRLTHSEANHCIRFSRFSGSQGFSRFSRFVSDLGAVGELRDILCRDTLAGLQPFGDFNQITDRLAGRDDPLVDV